MNRKKLIKKIAARILFSDFLEQEMPKDLKGELELIYELEYKRHVLKDKGVPKIIDLIDKKTKAVGLKISTKLKAVYENWLKTHSFEDPQQWAKDKITHNGEKPSEVEKEFKHWAKKDFWKIENFKDLNALPEFSKWLNVLYKNNPEKALEYVLRFPFKGAMELLKKYNDISFEKVILEFYEAIVFPEWKKHWKKEGLEKTYKRLSKTYEELRGIPLLSIPKIYTTINKALNETHQTGDMMDYIKMGFGVSKEDLDILSNLNVKQWDKEARDLIRNEKENEQ